MQPSDQVIVTYFSGKSSGRPIEIREFRELAGKTGMPVNQLIPYLEKTGALNYDNLTGIHSFTGNLEAFGIKERPNTTWDNYSGGHGQDNKILEVLETRAYEFWDPSSVTRIYRGIVVKTEHYNPKKEKTMKTSVEVITPEGKKFGIVSPSSRHYPRRFGHYEAPASRIDRLNAIVSGWSVGQLVLVRCIGSFTDRNDKEVLIHEPMTYIDEWDNATLKGKKIVTSRDGDTISWLPIIGNKFYKNGTAVGIGYYRHRSSITDGTYVIPVYVEGAQDKVQSIPPLIEDVGEGMEKDLFHEGEDKNIFRGRLPEP